MSLKRKKRRKRKYKKRRKNIYRPKILPTKFGKFPSETKRFIRERDNYTCQLCGRPAIQIHHIYERSQAIKDGWLFSDIISQHNGVVVCQKCHQFLHQGNTWRQYVKYFRSRTYNK